jgi:hypothetical protein
MPWLARDLCRPGKRGLLATYIVASAQGDQYEYVYGGPAGGAFSTDSLHLASEVVKVSQSCGTQKPQSKSALSSWPAEAATMINQHVAPSNAGSDGRDADR